MRYESKINGESTLILNDLEIMLKQVVEVQDVPKAVEKYWIVTSTFFKYIGNSFYLVKQELVSMLMDLIIVLVNEWIFLLWWYKHGLFLKLLDEDIGIVSFLNLNAHSKIAHGLPDI